MVEWLLRLEPWQQALAGTAFTYFMTALGAGLVFFFKEIKKGSIIYGTDESELILQPHFHFRY